MPDEVANTTPGEHATTTLADHRGIVRGRLTYDDNSPASGLPVSLEYGHFMTTSDATGRYRIDAASGRHQLCLGLIELEKFELVPGQEHIADHVVPHGARVSGVVVAAEDGAPLGRGWPCLYGGRVSTMTFARDDGTFEFGWIPSGIYHALVPASGPGRRTESVAFTVDSTDVVLRIEIPIVPPLSLRFENLPAEWRETIPLYIEIRDEAGLRHTVPPSNAIGGPHGPDSTYLDPTGRALNSPATPVPGKYALRLLHVAWSIPYLEVPFESPCRGDELVVRIPDGARVVVSQLREVTSIWGSLNGLVVGDACELLDPDSPQVVLPRVPSGRQTIWKTNTWSAVRLGQMDVPLSGDAMYVIDSDLDAGMRGAAVGDRSIQLLRDEVLVASKVVGSPQFVFSPLTPGRYVLVVDDERIPIALNARQVIDFGTQFAR